MPTDLEIGGPTAEERHQVYACIGLSPQNVRQVENMIQESGTRPVARAALTNVRVQLHSTKNGKPRVVESHTCELVFAYELELDPDVLGYYVQVPCRRVHRVTLQGRRHVSTATLDFLVFYANRVELVECKQQSWLRKQREHDAFWVEERPRWSYAPYGDWAAQNGLTFSVWVAPEPPGIYLQNLEACYAVSGDDLERWEGAAIAKAKALLRRRPASVEQLTAVVPGFGARQAMRMLAKSEAFGPWMSTPIAQPESFELCLDREQAAQMDDANLRAHGAATAQPSVVDPLLTASPTDLNRARERLARLKLINTGDLPPSRRMQKLARDVQKATGRGQSALSACLTSYSNSGNRSSRLLPEQEQAIETVIARHWNTGKVRRPKDLFHAFEKECEQLGVEPCGRGRLDARRRSEPPSRHALATGGFRAYHGVRSSTDPRSRSLTPIGYGQVLHIDSSNLDVRCAPDLVSGLPSGVATFYIGIDGGTGDTMAHALIFGSARTDGLALLIREYVKRQGFLPKMIHVDRGPENTSRWIRDFCEGRISLRHSPTAASAWNGIAENAIKQVNDQVAHQMVGSTAPDQRGRKVDGRFKSRRNAHTSFSAILDAFIAFIYGDLPATPRADGETPLEKKQQALSSYGEMGTPCSWNDDFLIQTSIKIDRVNADKQRGVRTVDGWFASDELMGALRVGKPDQIRSDCSDPTVLYVRIGDQWLKAFSSRVQSMALRSDREKLFELLCAPLIRRTARALREEISRERNGRQQLASFARPAIEHLAPVHREPDVEPSASVQKEVEHELLLVQSPKIDFRELAVFDEREDY